MPVVVAIVIASLLSAVLAMSVGLVLEMVQTNEGFAVLDDAAARWGARR